MGLDTCNFRFSCATFKKQFVCELEIKDEIVRKDAAMHKADFRSAISAHDFIQKSWLGTANR